MLHSTLNSNKSFTQSESHESIDSPIDSDQKVRTDSSVNIPIIEECKQSTHMQTNTHDTNQEPGSNYTASSDYSLTPQHLSKESDVVKIDDIHNPSNVTSVPVSPDYIMFKDQAKSVMQSVASNIVEPISCSKEDSCLQVVTQKTVQSSGKESLKAQGKHLKGRANVIAKNQELNTQSLSLKCSGAKEGVLAKESANVKQTTIENLARDAPLMESTEQFSVVKEGNSNEGSREADSTLDKIKVYQTAIQDQPLDVHLNQKLELTEGMSRILLVRLERIDNLIIKMYKRKMNAKRSMELPANKIERKASIDITNLNSTSKPKPSKVRSQSLTQESSTSFNLNQQDASSTLPVIKKTSEESGNTSTQQSSEHCARSSWSADCVVCKEKFMDRLELHKHATLSHSDKQILFCEFCGKTFLRERTLTAHRNAAHYKMMNIKKNTAKELLKKRKQDRIFKQQKQKITTAQCEHRAKLALAMDFQESVKNDADELITPTKETLKTKPKISLNVIKGDKQTKKDTPQKNRLLNNNRQLPCVSAICKNQLFNSSEVERKKYLLRLRSRFHQTFSDVQKLKERNKIEKDPMSCSTLLTSTIKTEEEDEINENSVSSSLSLIDNEKITTYNTVNETASSGSMSRMGIRKMKNKIVKKLIIPLIRLEDIPTTRSFMAKTGKLAYLARKKKAVVQKKKTAQHNKMKNKNSHALDLVANVAKVKKNVNSSKSKKNEQSCKVTTEILQKQNDATSDKCDREIITEDENTAKFVADKIQCDKELEQILSSNIHMTDIESLKSDDIKSNTAITKNNLSNVSNQDYSCMMQESTVTSNDSVEKAIEDLFKNGTWVENTGQEKTVQDTVMFERHTQKSDEDKYFENHMMAIHGMSHDPKKIIGVDKHMANTSAETFEMHKTKASTTNAKTNLTTTENSSPKSEYVNVQETSLKSKQDAKIIAKANYKKDNSTMCKGNTVSKVSKQCDTNNALQLDADNEKTKMQKTFSKIVETKGKPKEIENKELTMKKCIPYTVHKKDIESVEKGKKCKSSRNKAVPAKFTLNYHSKEVSGEPAIEQELKLKNFSKSFSPRDKYLEEAIAIPKEQAKPFGSNINMNGLCSMCKNVLESMIELKGNHENQETPIKCPFCDSYFVSFHFLECHVGHIHTTCNCKTATKMTKAPQKNVNCMVNEELAFECRYCPKRFDCMTEFNDHAINAHSTSANCKGTIKTIKSESLIDKQNIRVQLKKDEVKSEETIDNLQKVDKSIDACKKDEVNKNKESCQDKKCEQSKSIDGKNKSPAQNYNVKKYPKDYAIACRPCHENFSSQQEYIHHIEHKHKRIILSAKDAMLDDISKAVKKSVISQKNIFENCLYNSSSLDEESVTNNSIETDERLTQNETRESINDVTDMKDNTVLKETSCLYDKDSADNGKVTLSDEVVTKFLPSGKYENKYKQSCVPTTSHSNVQKSKFSQNMKTYTRNKNMDMESKMSFSGNDKKIAATIHIEKLNLTQVEKSDVTESVHTLYPCSGCKEVFLDVGRLNQHRATNHRSYFRFVCDICFMSFKKLEDVSVHKLKHKYKVVPNKESPQPTTKETTIKSTSSEVECRQKKVKTISRNSSTKDIVRKENNSLCKSLANDNCVQNHSSNGRKNEKENNYICLPWKSNYLFDNLSSEFIKDDCTLNSNIMQCHSFHRNSTNNRHSIKTKTVNPSKSVQCFTSDVKSSANNTVSPNKDNDTSKHMIQDQSVKENRSYELESILTDDRSVLWKELKKDLNQEKNIHSSLKPVKFKITNDMEEVVVKVIGKSKSTPESKSTEKNQSGLLGKHKIVDRDYVPMKMSKLDNDEKMERTAIKAQCYVCDKQFSFQEELHRHLQFIHNKSFEYTTNNSFSSQVKKERVKPKKINVVPVATSESVTCEHCAMRFDSVSLMKNHKSMVHKSLQKRTWFCNICDQRFTLLQKYLLHRFYIHYDQSLVHVCENCDKVLTSVAMVNIHVCKNVTSWFCRPCNKSFSNGMALRVHNAEAHLETIGPHACDMCKKEFLTVGMLSRHKNTEHSSVVSSSCERMSPTKNTSSNEYRHKCVEKSSNSQMRGNVIPKTKSQALEVLLESMVDSHESNNDRQDNQDESETKVKKFPCGLCKQVCQTKVGLKIHLTRTHQTTAEVCHICYKVCVYEKMIQHIIEEHIVYDKSNEIKSVVADQSDMEQYNDRIDEVLGMKRLLSLCEYEVFNDEPRGKCLSCPLCPQLFATPRFFKIHHLWSHDTLCVMCDLEFKFSQEAAEHKAQQHGSVGSYMWVAENLVKAVVRTNKYGENIRNVIFEIVSKELGKCSSITDVEMNDIEKKQEESDVQTNYSYNSELPDSTNLDDVTAKTNDSELQDLLEDYRNDFLLMQEEEQNILDILEESDKNDDQSVSEDETMERLKELIREEIKEVPNAVFCPKRPEELRSNVDDENFVLVVTEEDLVQYKNDIKGLASRITSTCSIFSIDDIEKLLTDYMQSIQKTQTTTVDKD